VRYVLRFLRAHKIDLAARKSWCESNDPAFAAKAAEIIGLPLDGALVLAIDEKPSIQALERAQGYLKLPNGVGGGLRRHSCVRKRATASTVSERRTLATTALPSKRTLWVNHVVRSMSRACPLFAQ